MHCVTANKIPSSQILLFVGVRRSVDLVGSSSSLTVAVSVSRAVYASPCHSRLAVSSPPAASGAAPCMGIG